jgi:5-methylcytosine-specific restriction endonuclease McrA
MGLLWKSLVRGAHKFVGLDSPYAQQEYGRNWSAQRQQCLNRDDHQCRVCGATEKTLDRSLCVHHIRPRAEFDTEEWRTYNALSNLITLCPSCHGTFEGRFRDADPTEFVTRANKAND